MLGIEEEVRSRLDMFEEQLQYFFGIQGKEEKEDSAEGEESEKGEENEKDEESEKDEKKDVGTISRGLPKHMEIVSILQDLLYEVAIVTFDARGGHAFHD